ncbi:MAG TPA: hypothetical protein VFM14_10855 [Gemmatimonadales bacterium]|nr:hypothetical protein [Gemmatimonadales bacterium]
MRSKALRSFADAATASATVHWILRASVWACFVGHGMFGIRQKQEWVVFFEPFGIGPAIATALMPLIGLVDITVGYLALLRPTRAVFMYAALWGTFTGLLRPLVGLSVLETFERAGNVGPSLALLLGTGTAAILSQPVIYNLADPARQRRITWLLSATTFLLLLGHGGLAALGKPQLLQHWSALGVVQPDAAGLAFVRAIGYGEMAAAGLVLLWPSRPLCLAIVGWKLFTESLFVVAGAPIWEVVERCGSYGAPLALFVVLAYRASDSVTRNEFVPVTSPERSPA